MSLEQKGTVNERNVKTANVIFAETALTFYV